MDYNAIKVEHLHKTFRLPHEQTKSIKSSIVNFYKIDRGVEKQEALKDISFQVKKGEFFGIVGRNGSGKSTLLKALAGIYTPDRGTIDIKGKLIPFIELGVGFSPELSGRDNVFLNGSLLGFSRKEMRGMYNEIVEFAELERFMDQKLKNYSSGMQVRLAFSIAIRAKSDILLLDEVLAVGDASFQRKCLAYFGDLKRRHQTVVFVSHDMESVRKYCDRAIMIEDGLITSEGDPKEVTKKYAELFLEDKTPVFGDNSVDDLALGMGPSSKIDRSLMSIDKVWMADKTGETINVLKEDMKHFLVNIKVTAKKKPVTFVPGVNITDLSGQVITASSSYWASDKQTLKLKPEETAIVTFKLPNVYEIGDYKIYVNTVSSNLETFYSWKNEAISFYSNRRYTTGGLTNPYYEVKLHH